MSFVSAGRVAGFVSYRIVSLRCVAGRFEERRVPKAPNMLSMLESIFKFSSSQKSFSDFGFGKNLEIGPSSDNVTMRRAQSFPAKSGAAQESIPGSKQACSTRVLGGVTHCEYSGVGWSETMRRRPVHYADGSLWIQISLFHSFAPSATSVQ